jgi:hypothetical protein
MVEPGSSAGPQILQWRGYTKGRGKNDFEFSFNWAQLARGIPSKKRLESFQYSSANLDLLGVRKPSNSKSSHHSPEAFYSLS